MNDLPECKHRGNILPGERCVCLSNCLVKTSRDDSVPFESCRTCERQNEDCPPPKQWKPERRGLGDIVAAVLQFFGITPERIEKITGKPCGCKKRQEKLNRFWYRITRFWRRCDKS